MSTIFEFYGVPQTVSLRPFAIINSTGFQGCGLAGSAT